MATSLPIAEPKLAAFCRAHGIRRLSLFGSELKGRARPDSDIDLLVEFEPQLTPGLLGLANMEAELSHLMGGRRVDFRTPNDLSPLFRDAVIQSAEIKYAA
jgi:hypothetical protein